MALRNAFELVSTAAKQDTGNTSLASLDGKLSSLGQKTMAQSVPITLASDQPVLPILASSLLFGTVAYTTTNSIANLRTDSDVKGYAQKTFIVKNTGANSADISVFGSVDGGTNFDVTLSNGVALASGNTLVVQDSSALTTIRVQAKSTVSNTPTTLDSRAFIQVA